VNPPQIYKKTEKIAPPRSLFAAFVAKRELGVEIEN
jgi:hypothetical protein